MSTGRNLTSWLLLGLLTLVAAGATILGISQSPKDAPLQQAWGNTLRAANYSEVLDEVTPQGKQTDYLVYQAPDRLGGYIQSGTKRTYVYVIGRWEYQSLTVAAGAPTDHLTFYRQASQGAKALDPAHGYLPYAQQAKDVSKTGNTYSFALSETTGQVKQTGKFSYFVSGPYVLKFNLSVATASVDLVISQVGTSRPVQLPAGYKVIRTG